MKGVDRRGHRLHGIGWALLAGLVVSCQGSGRGEERDPSVFAEGLGDPAGIAVSAEGRVYVADAKKGVVRVFDPLGRTLRNLGKGTLQNPLGVAIGHGGRIWVSDSIGDRIYVFDPGGRLVRAFGRSGEGPGMFSGAGPLAWSPTKSLYAIDIDHNRIQVFDTRGKLLRVFGKTGRFRDSAPGEFYWPGGIAVDAEGRVFVADTHDFRIQRFSTEGKFEIQFGYQGEGLGGFDHVFGLAVDDAKNLLYCADDRVKLASGGRRVDVFTLDGKPLGSLAPEADRPALIHPFDVAIAADGWILVTERGQGRVRRVDPTRLRVSANDGKAPTSRASSPRLETAPTSRPQPETRPAR